jgi:anti-anti-sigma factor
MSLNVTLHERMPGIFIVSPVGSLDTNTYMILKERVDAILKDSPKLIVFDMEQLEYISSMGVGVIIHAQKEIKKQEGTFKMVNLQPQIKKVFDVIHALPSQQVFESVEELDEYLDQMQKPASQ